MHGLTLRLPSDTYRPVLVTALQVLCAAHRAEIDALIGAGVLPAMLQVLQDPTSNADGVLDKVLIAVSDVLSLRHTLAGLAASFVGALIPLLRHTQPLILEGAAACLANLNPESAEGEDELPLATIRVAVAGREGRRGPTCRSAARACATAAPRAKRRTGHATRRRASSWRPHGGSS